ncbi:hypothetical protein PTRG_06804 [Pyrenophora tritici-repentis Pt-1C-BFP]|uniref:Uncharacterized protein n=1 Tax=Pyrenophora tritici-repentis (strain Pt-1C-BFP) TaxID=426418 RepID=B2W9Z6_PYRTR|nr:uncharacterized protein PTRG_06804 [Pyrenophora tritici-repentis Pt-1C-BFP]EDU49724.1 hypothetical protein PTRG_06804 [Pyrenophora tritici-repentis Pt-1C-BFP]
MQGFNMGRYYPPDATNPPTFNSSSHPLGTRARKLPQGILTVRFELPFAVWCNTCKPSAIIGQGHARVEFPDETFGVRGVVGDTYGSGEERVWRDPYDVNAKLRGEFRKKRKVWRKEDRHKEGMQEKFSLGLDIADETEGDRTRAALVEFGAAGGDAGTWKPLFSDSTNTETAVEPVQKTKKLKAEAKAEESRLGLQKRLITNTKAAVDPFLLKDGGGRAKERVNLGIVKRKREGIEGAGASAIPPVASTAKADKEGTRKKPDIMAALVGYDSD